MARTAIKRLAMEHSTLRLSPADMERCRKLVVRMQSKGLAVNLSSLVRMFVSQGLERLEREYSR